MNIEQAKDILVDNLSDDEIITEYNEYCEYCNDMDSLVYSMNEFDELDEIPRIEFLKNMRNKNDRDYYKVDKVFFSPALRYTEIDYMPVTIDHDSSHYVKSNGMGCGYLYKSDRYVDGLYWDDETMEYVDDDGVPYNFEVVE